jgi:hypothetical protein
MAGNVRPLMIQVEHVPESVPAPAASASLPAPAPEVQAERQATELQALSENAKTGDTLEMLGVTYRLGDKIGLMPLLRYAHIAKKGAQANDMDGLDAIYTLLQDCIHEDDWERFEQDMIAKKAGEQELMDVVSTAIEIMSARPTQRPGDSSSGSSRTTASSTASSSAAPRRVPPGAEDLVPVDRLAASSG